MGIFFCRHFALHFSCLFKPANKLDKSPTESLLMHAVYKSTVNHLAVNRLMDVKELSIKWGWGKIIITTWMEPSFSLAHSGHNDV